MSVDVDAGLTVVCEGAEGATWSSEHPLTREAVIDRIDYVIGRLESRIATLRDTRDAVCERPIGWAPATRW